MKKSKILCAVLAALLVAFAAAAGATASEASASVTDLGWRTHPHFTNPSALATTVVVDTAFGGEDNQALRISETGRNLHAFELVSAEAMKGVTAYTVEMDLKYTKANRLGFLLNGGKDAGGDRAGIFHSTGLENQYYDTNGKQTDYTANRENVFDKPADVIHLSVSVEQDKKTVTVSLLQKNGEPVRDSIGTPVDSVLHTPAATAASGVYLLVSELEATVDNIKVTNTHSNTVIYFEDFESHGRAQVAYVGSQETAVTEGVYNVRFLAVLGDLYEYTDYQNVGIKITLNGKTLNEPCKSVYSSVIAGALLAEQTEVTAESKGGKYLMAMTITDIPVSAGELTFTVTPYFETEDGVTEGASYAVTYRAGAFVSSAPIA